MGPHGVLILTSARDHERDMQSLRQASSRVQYALEDCSVSSQIRFCFHAFQGTSDLPVKELEPHLFHAAIHSAIRLDANQLANFGWLMWVLKLFNNSTLSNILCIASFAKWPFVDTPQI